MPGGIYRRKPKAVQAMQLDGGIENIDSMISWVAKIGHRQSLYVSGEGRIGFRDAYGTEDVFEGWWLVLEGTKFTVLTNEEFKENYEEVKDG